MHMPDTPSDTAPGWTPARRGKFLALLAENGNIRLSATRCGLSAQSVYKLRRRDGIFARGWDAALVMARAHAEHVMADRALEGVEEPIFYRGEQVGTRRRYDTRLLLAHLARLDRLAESRQASQDADRFDELLALIAGEAPPAALGQAGGGLPRPRAAHADEAASEAEMEEDYALPPAYDEDSEIVRDAAVQRVRKAAWQGAAGEWDDWFTRACARVDGLTAVPQPVHHLSDSPILKRPGLRAWTLTTVSTAGMAKGMLGLPLSPHPTPARQQAARPAYPSPARGRRMG